jgi:Putative Ig domain
MTFNPLQCAKISMRLFLFIAILISSLARGESESTPGVPWTGPLGVSQRTDQIMERERQSHEKQAHSHTAKIHPRPRPDFQNLPANPDSPSVVSWPPPTNSSGAYPQSPQSTSVNFLAATLPETEFSFPPDTMGAAGPTQFIAALNGRFRSFNKATGSADGILNANSDIFFQPVLNPGLTNNFTTDPRIRFDRLSGRWFISMADVPGGGTLPNHILLAVSDGSVITSSNSWTLYSFQQDLVSPTGDSGSFADYPTLGIDANALYIGVNIFGTRGLGSFSDTTVFVIRKSSLLSGGPIVVTALRNLITKVQGKSTGPYTPQGVDNYDPAATEGYVIGVDAGFYGKLQLRRISNPGGTPSISGNITITIPLNGSTITVPHLGNTGGTSGNLDGLDYRLMGAHLRNGRLWTTENIAVDNMGAPSTVNPSVTRMGVRWYELNGIPTGQTPGVVQSGTVYRSSATNGPDVRCFWMGSVMVSGQGHAAMGFSVAGAGEYINAGTVGRLANDPAGTMRSPLLYTASFTTYNPSGDPGSAAGRRWGDYSYTCLDPSDDMTMWTIQQFCNAANSYGVQVVRLLAPGPATPSSCSPPSIATGTANANVIVVGTTNGDTGFFDPGLGFSNRISASVSGGGVTVNSVTYTDPTHITLNLSVSGGASLGARNVTVTNPDGQSATNSSGILTIVSGGSTNQPPVLASIPNKTITEQTTLTFTNSATDPDGNALTYSLDAPTPSGASVNPSSGVFTWTPTEAQGPMTTNLTVRVTDNGSPPLSDAKTFSVTVLESNRPPVLTAIANRTIHAGISLVITNVATDPDLPTNTLTFSLSTNSPAGAVIDSASGIFQWTTSDAFANSTKSITVKVTDNGAPPLSDSKSFTVTVAPRPIVEAVALSNNLVSLSWNSISSQVYRVQFKQNLTSPNWTNLPPDVTATGPTAVKTDTLGPSTARLYRVQVLP